MTRENVIHHDFVNRLGNDMICFVALHFPGIFMNLFHKCVYYRKMNACGTKLKMYTREVSYLHTQISQ